MRRKHSAFGSAASLGLSMDDVNPRDSSSLRVLYYAGPGDIVGTFRHYSSGRDDPREVAMTYSGQFFEACGSTSATFYAISRCESGGSFTWNGSTAINRHESEHGGWKNEVNQFVKLRRIIADVRQFKPDVIVIQEGTIEWYWLTFLESKKLLIIPDLHCGLWPQNLQKKGLIRRLRSLLSGRFFGKVASKVLCISEEVARQVKEVSSTAKTEVVRCAYRQHHFDGVVALPHSAPFHVAYMGRVEKDKGVLDMVWAADQLQQRSPNLVHFHVCGSGGAMPQLRALIKNRGLEKVVNVYGRLDRDRLLEVWRGCHLTLVPTTEHFAEGLNKSAIESVLLRRPVIATSVVPARDLLVDACISVSPGDIEQMACEIEKMARQNKHYDSYCLACDAVRAGFFEGESLWGQAMRRILASARPLVARA